MAKAVSALATRVGLLSGGVLPGPIYITPLVCGFVRDSDFMSPQCPSPMNGAYQASNRPPRCPDQPGHVSLTIVTPILLCVMMQMLQSAFLLALFALYVIIQLSQSYFR